MASSGDRAALVAEFCADVGLPPDEVDRLRWAPGPCLPGRLAAGRLATGAVGCLGLAATLGRPTTVTLEPARVAATFRADQLQRVNGVAVEGFAPGSGFFRTADGWVRTHANYPHHRAALLRVLDLSADAGRDAIAAALIGHRSETMEQRVYAVGGVAVAVRTYQQWRAHPQAGAVGADPLVAYTRHEGPGTGRRDRLRVLDLTRVIAGPVATRALAWLGHDVLRLDAPWLPEIQAQHLDTGAGKRTALLDVVADRATRDELVDGADVVVTGYRPGGLDRAGLGAADLLARNPRLIVATLSAWGATGPWGGRRGFDSIVQAATGISLIEGDPDRPGALAAQALDHATGYLLAAAVLRAAHEGGGHEIRLSLARTAQWLLGQPHADDTASPDVSHCLVDRDTYAGLLRGPLPALELPGVAPTDYPFPARPFGTDLPAWPTVTR
jgi:hypothetical protein